MCMLELGHAFCRRLYQRKQQIHLGSIIMEQMLCASRRPTSNKARPPFILKKGAGYGPTSQPEATWRLGCLTVEKDLSSGSGFSPYTQTFLLLGRSKGRRMHRPPLTK